METRRQMKNTNQADAPFVVFYSWQSELPEDDNRGAIRAALRLASIEIEAKGGRRHIVIDEATRNLPGSPNIPQAILDKIRAADMFVADITTTTGHGEQDRPGANANVIFELGFAVASLGWDRVVMLFNKGYGNFPDDLPFDFDRHRASPYELPDKAQSKAPQRYNSLRDICRNAIKAILEVDPKLPADLAGKTDAEKKRLRDIANLKWILAMIHFPTLDSHVENVPDMIHDKIFHFWEQFDSTFRNSLFHLYDQKAFAALERMHQHWRETLSHDEFYDQTNNPSVYTFRDRTGLRAPEEAEKALEAIRAAARGLRNAMRDLLRIVRHDYLEVDIDETNKTAWEDYLQEMKEAQQNLRIGPTS
jgi:hypothetical protein